jgi:hypothetical protein
MFWLANSILKLPLVVAKSRFVEQQNPINYNMFFGLVESNELTLESIPLY